MNTNFLSRPATVNANCGRSTIPKHKIATGWRPRGKDLRYTYD